MSSQTRIQLEEWLRTIDVKADNVLDIGGSQYPIEGRTKSWDVKDYKILDLEHPHDCRHKPDIFADINSLSDVDNINDYSVYFDVIFCLEVIEYVYNVDTMFAYIDYLIKKNGILYLSTHFIYPIHNPVIHDCMRLTPLGIERILKQRGFEIVEHIPRRAKSNKIMEFYAEEGMRPAKQTDHLVVGSLIKARKL